MKSFSKIPLDLKQGAALTMLSLLPITAVVIEPGNTAIVLTKFTIFLHASILATASVFWFIKHRFSCLIFLAYAIGLMLLLFRIGATSLPEFLILDLLTGIIFILAKPALTLKRSGIINAIYLSLVTLRLI
ncbi:MAG: hypothetical protein K2X77_19010 [Candidatus Obscuribacterales bacterium]|jgi:hypothetical protein|nr:hypothetical protein [Candidatus Obscuribacterales bacterium]